MINRVDNQASWREGKEEKENHLGRMTFFSRICGQDRGREEKKRKEEERTTAPHPYPSERALSAIRRILRGGEKRGESSLETISPITLISFTPVFEK